MSLPWQNLLQYVNPEAAASVEPRLRVAYRTLFGSYPQEVIEAHQGLALALLELLQQMGLPQDKATRAIEQLLSICEQTVEAPTELQTVAILDDRYLTWRNCRTPLDLDSGLPVTRPPPPSLVSVAIVLNELLRRVKVSAT